MARIRWISIFWPLLAMSTARAGWVDDVGLELRFDDNLPRGQLQRDIKSDTAVVASAATGVGYQITDNGRLSLTLSLSASAYRRYSGLNNANAGVEVAYHHRFGLGPLAPDLRAAASAVRLEYRDHWRDGWLYSAQLGMEKRITERLGLSATYQIEQRESDDIAVRLVPTIAADVHDVFSRNFIFAGDYTLSPEYVISAAYTIRDGEVVSTTLRNFPIFLASSAIADDPVFGTERYAYKMKAITRGISLGLSRLIASHASFTVGYEYLDSRAKGGIDYQANIVRATYLHQF